MFKSPLDLTKGHINKPFLKQICSKLKCSKYYYMKYMVEVVQYFCAFDVYELFFSITVKHYTSMVLELEGQETSPEILRSMKSWNENWLICTTKTEPCSLLPVLLPTNPPSLLSPKCCQVMAYNILLLVVVLVDYLTFLLYFFFFPQVPL